MEKSYYSARKHEDPYIFVLVKKALIITYYWPPSGGGGVQRWLKFVKYLRDFGWEPIIYTPENPDFEIKDTSLEADVPDGIKVIKRPIWEPFSLYRRFLGKKAVQQQGVVSESRSFLSRLAIWIRGNYFIPDSRVFWVRPSANYLTKYLNKHKVDVIITTGPPHSVHLIGLELKKRTSVPWLADFRDPWSQWDVLDLLQLNQRSRRNHKRLEQHVLKSADLVLATSPSTEKSFRDLGAKSTALITNGFDTEVLNPDGTLPAKFRIAHIGLLNQLRNPEMLWEVLDGICSEDKEFKNDLEIYLAGTVDHQVFDAINKLKNLEQSVFSIGYLSHQDTLKEYKKAALLLLLVNNSSNSKLILPAKLFEYINQNRPILAFGAPESDVSVILEETGFKGCLDYNDKVSMRKEILEHYKNFKQKNYPFRGQVTKFSRKELTKQLAILLDKIV